ncbi:elmo domain-containing protein 3-like [Stylonychia lemnae]|uniref:Elmo domain-containing protein 3-like n=1 Tax=Stylonychia lemnae TaxID=5949 RepID=A0A078AAV7_STYLE|nr:elmo domain-containing protein 3-like [Stylonychia lemnae]|eukprot:CDW79344.1 elmo domain-containing protein 3-like [Stylonychia lemnae]
MVKNCLACIFPKLLEGLTHPDQRDQLPIRKKKSQQYQRVSNPNDDEEEDDEEADEEIKSSNQIGDKPTAQSNEEDQNQFFNEFQSWRSSQSNPQKTSNANNSNSPSKNGSKGQQQQQTELAELKPAKKGQILLTLTENEIEQQKNKILDEGSDDLFKGFTQQSQKERKLPPAPSVNRDQRSKAQLNNLFNDLTTNQTTNQSQNSTDLSGLPIFQSDVQQLNSGQNEDSKQDILEEKGWDDEININIDQISEMSNLLNILDHDNVNYYDNDNFGDLDLNDIEIQEDIQVKEDATTVTSSVEHNKLFDLSNPKQKTKVKKEEQKQNQDDSFEHEFNEDGGQDFLIGQAKLQNNFDDEFDYDDGEDQKVVEVQTQKLDKMKSDTQIIKKEENQDQQSQKPDFKKFLPTKDEVRRKNYIGDAIIAERNEGDEIDDDSDQPQNYQDGNNVAGYRSKMMRITQICEESIKDYKDQIKQLNIKQAEDDIVKKAKREAQKIEEYKNKFRQSAFGGVITNQLSSSLERIKQKFAMTEEDKTKYQQLQEQLSQRDSKQSSERSNKRLIKVKKIIKSSANQDDSQIPIEIGKSQDQKKALDKKESNNYDIDIEMDNKIDDNKLQQAKKKKKKKKNKGGEDSHRQKNFQLQSSEEKEELKENIQIYKEDDYRQAYGELVSPVHQNKTQQVKQVIDNIQIKQNVKQQIEIPNNKFTMQQNIQMQKFEIEEHNDQSTVDWDELNRKNKQKVMQKGNEEDEKEDIARRQIVYSYEQARDYFQSKADLQSQIQQARQIHRQQQQNQGFFQKLANCFTSSKFSNPQLESEKDLILGLTLLKLETSLAEHEIIIKSIYRKLLPNDQNCRTIGAHWGNIGFQGNDPKTDLRGGGMLGILNLLYFVDKLPKTSILILKHSQIQQSEFPMAVKMLEMTVIIIKLLKQSKLTALCNQEHSVIETVNKLFCAAFLMFMETYISRKCNITNVDELNKQVEAELRGNLRGVTSEYFQIDDDKGESLLKQSYKNQKEYELEKIRKLMDKADNTQFVVKQESNHNAQKARNYASSEQFIQKEQRPQKPLSKNGKNEFSEF